MTPRHRAAAALLGTLVLTGVVAWRVDLSASAALLRQARPGPFLLAAALGPVQIALSGLRWQRVSYAQRPDSRGKGTARQEARGVRTLRYRTTGHHLRWPWQPPYPPIAGILSRAPRTHPVARATHLSPDAGRRCHIICLVQTRTPAREESCADEECGADGFLRVALHRFHESGHPCVESCFSEAQQLEGLGQDRYLSFHSPCVS